MIPLLLCCTLRYRETNLHGQDDEPLRVCTIAKKMSTGNVGNTDSTPFCCETTENWILKSGVIDW